jgi:hypothetical protein
MRTYEITRSPHAATVTIIEDGERIGESGVCLDPDCQCDGIWHYWGVGIAPAEVAGLAL